MRSEEQCYTSLYQDILLRRVIFYALISYSDIKLYLSRDIDIQIYGSRFDVYGYYRKKVRKYLEGEAMLQYTRAYPVFIDNLPRVRIIFPHLRVLSLYVGKGEEVPWNELNGYEHIVIRKEDKGQDLHVPAEIEERVEMLVIFPRRELVKARIPEILTFQ